MFFNGLRAYYTDHIIEVNMKKTATKLTKEELELQRNFSDKIKEIYKNKKNGTAKAFVDTYGCQQNFADSEMIKGMLIDMGFELTDDENQADIAVFNTCAIREHAEMRVLGNVGKLKQRKKSGDDLVIVVCGCMAQQEQMKDKILKSYPYVDILFGTYALYTFPELFYEYLTEKKRAFDISGDETGRIFEGIHLKRDRSIKANLPIMYGCNNFCTYCIVPYVRGRERSRDKEDIIRDFKDILKAGYKEITLLGQNVNSYGSDRGYETDFADLLDELASIEGDYIIRFMTSHPKDATEKLFKVMAKHDTIAKQLHLPFQSGSDRILESMNRGYTKEKYLGLIDMARKYMPDISFSSDVIVGFPGEVYEDFEKTLEIVKTVKYDQLFTFIYSRRPGTKAALMEDVITAEEKQKMFDELLKVQQDIGLERNTAEIGKTFKTLVDGESFDENFPLSTHIEGGRLVKAKGDKSLIGKFARVKVTKASPHALFGEIVE